MTAPVRDGMRSAVVVGGGTAGYFAALALKRAFPLWDVTLIESSKIPVIGVGEATTTLMPPFLHQQLGVDIVELYREVRPTWKLGIKFEWGLPGQYFFTYPFGASSPIEAYAHEGRLDNQSVVAQLMAADRTPIVSGDDGRPISLLPDAKFAYHLDNKTFVAYLATLGRRADIHHIDAEITQVVPTADREQVERLILDDGREVRADLYVDASGFRSLMIEKTLGSPFTSYASSLFCDTAVVATVPQRGPIQPYTTAETMEAGWCWRIPVEGEDHRGYVHSSAHLTPEQALAEMRAKNPEMGEPWTVRFRSGRHHDFWKGNTVAVGNAYGFVEPLESTALHMVIIEMAYLVGALKSAGDGEPDRAFANSSVAQHWDYLRWFLAIHYKFNRRKDTAFWRDCRESVDVSGLQALLDRFRTVGPWDEEANRRHATGDPSFSFEGIMILLLGQQVPTPRPTRTTLSTAEWQARVAEAKALVDRALPQAEALSLLRERPELLQDVVTSPDSWINLGGEVISGVSSRTGMVRPQSDRPKRGPYNRLFDGITARRR
jgi:tryptophan 7-halogenase